jgi:hypothetical protein
MQTLPLKGEVPLIEIGGEVPGFVRRPDLQRHRQRQTLARGMKITAHVAAAHAIRVVGEELIEALQGDVEHAIGDVHGGRPQGARALDGWPQDQWDLRDIGEIQPGVAPAEPGLVEAGRRLRRRGLTEDERARFYPKIPHAVRPVPQGKGFQPGDAFHAHCGDGDGPV